MKQAYISPEMNLDTVSSAGVIRTSDGFDVVIGNGDGDRVSVNKLLGTDAP